jgi:HlyD family secretion protein
LEQVRADIAGATAGLERATLNLELTNIYSPVDGVVISRNVDIGQTVAASLSAPIIFQIANDLTEMQVKASIDEADIGKISQGAPVHFTVDAYPRDTFRGVIDEVRLEPATVQNVVTYSVIVGVSNPDLKLKPGMTANITVTVASKDNVLTVPNAALRFTPSGLSNEDIQQMLPQRPGQRPAGANAEARVNGAGQGNRGARGNGQRGVLWTLDAAGQPLPKGIRTGLTDGTRTEVIGADLAEGDLVVLGSLEAGAAAATTAPARPTTTGMPFGMPGGIGGGRGRGGF